MSTVENWLERARYDLDTASAMLDSGRYLYVVFCCQQAIEKALKAVILQKTNEFPPRIHNLLRLTELGGIEMEPERESFIGELSGYYIQTRYPEEIEVFEKFLDKATAQEVVLKTKEAAQWLFSMIASSSEP